VKEVSFAAQMITVTITVVIFVATVVGIYWKVNLRINLMEKDFRIRIEALTKRVEATEKLDISINKKLDFIGTNIQAILKRLKMKPQKNIYEDQ